MSLSGGGPEGFGLLSLAFPSKHHDPAKHNRYCQLKKKKQMHLYPSLGVALSAEKEHVAPLQRALDN